MPDLPPLLTGELDPDEMIALAAVAQCDAAEVIAANQDRESRGLGMAYDGCQSDARDRLLVELRRRGVLR